MNFNYTCFPSWISIFVPKSISSTLINARHSTTAFAYRPCPPSVSACCRFPRGPPCPLNTKNQNPRRGTSRPATPTYAASGIGAADPNPLPEAVAVHQVHGHARRPPGRAQRRPVDGQGETAFSRNQTDAGGFYQSKI